MKKYPKQLLILEGFEYNYQDYLKNENSPRGMLLSIVLSHNTPIIYTKDAEDTAKFLILLANRENKKQQEKNTNKEDDYAIRHTPIKRSLQEQKQFILEGFPSIGPTSSKKLLNKYKNLQDIFNAPIEDLEKILKPQKAKSLKDILEK
jgi:Fanconi anemia group M protein